MLSFIISRLFHFSQWIFPNFIFPNDFHLLSLSQFSYTCHDFIFTLFILIPYDSKTCSTVFKNAPEENTFLFVIFRMLFEHSPWTSIPEDLHSFFNIRFENYYSNRKKVTSYIHANMLYLDLSNFIFNSLLYFPLICQSNCIQLCNVLFLILPYFFIFYYFHISYTGQ